jgi:hypothetical protein
VAGAGGRAPARLAWTGWLVAAAVVETAVVVGEVVKAGGLVSQTLVGSLARQSSSPGDGAVIVPL